MTSLPARTRSCVIARAVVPASTLQSVYTCPAGFITLVKTWIVHNPGASPAVTSAGVRPIDDPTLFVISSEEVQPGALIFWERWLVLDPGDQLMVQTSASEARFHAYGTLLRA